MFKQLGIKRKPIFMIIPMIDIIFFLLVFFIMNSLETTSQKVLAVNLPQAQTVVAQKQLPVVITLNASGQVTLDTQAMGLTDMAEYLSEKVKENPQLAVVLRADAQVAHGQVVEIMDMVRRAGIKKFSIAAKQQ